MDDFTLRLQNLVSVLETVGEMIHPRRLVENLLRVIPKSLRQVAVAIQVTADLSTLTLEDASGQLRMAQQCDTEDDGPSPPRVDGKLYLTREQGEVQSRDKKGEGSSAGSRSGNHQWQRCNSSGGGPSAIPGQKAGPDHCRRCGKTGQWARDCPMKPQN